MSTKRKWEPSALPAAEALVTELSGIGHLGTLKGTDLQRSPLKVTCNMVAEGHGERIWEVNILVTVLSF
jgi:hypothetical protein